MSVEAEQRRDSLGPYVPGLLANWQGDLPGIEAVEGTLVYADVSGFTRLSERLARKGKAGAEEVVRVISDVWAELLEAAGDGDPLKFAGDALIVFFQGEGHALRAASSALSMQAALKRRASIKVGRGSVRLRMSVGVHSGTFLMAAVGSKHLDLLILGRDATSTVAMETAAGPGEVLISRTTAQLLGSSLLSADEKSEGLSIRRVEAPTGVGPGRIADATDPRRFISPLLRAPLESGSFFEHRRVTIGFAQLGGVDELSESSGLDEVFSLVQDFTADLMERLDVHGVLLTSCDLGPDGATFMMSAGAPRADADHELRMLHVARETLGQTVGLPMRWGVNSGHVFAGTVGPPARRAYVTMGDTTNLAARVMAKASWGELLATRNSLPSNHSRLLLRPVEPFSVKGKRAPVEAVVVDDLATANADELAVREVFVGRESELSTLRAAAGSARAGTPHILEISGEVGVGKSRLVAEVRTDWSGTSLTVICDPFERTSAYHAARMFLRSALGIPVDAETTAAGAALIDLTERVAPHLIPWLPLLGVVLDVEIAETAEAGAVDPRYRRVKAQQVAADLIEALGDTPTLLTIEDAEHMDDASAELISEILGRIEDRPWLVLITRVPGTEGLHHDRGYEAETMELTPLNPADSMELALRLAESRPVPSHLIDEIVDRAGGNPLFTTELIAHAGEELPHSVEDMMAARIDALAPDDRRSLRLLAVLGETFDVDLVATVLSAEAVETTDDGLWHRLIEFVERSGNQIRFTSPLVRQVAYDGLPYQTRRRIHGLVADALGKRRRNQLPLHLARAERWQETWQAARDAGDRSRRAAANAVAAELYEMALEAADHLDIEDLEISLVAESCATMWARAGRPERALDRLARAVSHSQHPVRRAQLEALRASIYEDAGRLSQALRLLTLAIGRLEADEVAGAEPALSALHAGYASVRLRQGQLSDAADHATSALAAARAGGDRRLEANALHLLDRVHTAMGEATAAQEYRDSALPLFAEIGDLAAQGTALHDLAADAHRSGRWAEASWLYQRAIDARSRAGDVLRTAASTNALGEVELELDALDDAERRFTEALRAWRGARSPEGVAAAALNLGKVRLGQDRLREAVDLLEEAEELSDDIGSIQQLNRVRLMLAEAYARQDRHVEAWERASSVLASTDTITEAKTARTIRAAALEATGSGERAARERSLIDTHQ